MSEQNREQWIENRETELFPVPYFHVVFTLPDVLNKTALHEPKMLYDFYLNLPGKRFKRLVKIEV